MNITDLHGLLVIERINFWMGFVLLSFSLINIFEQKSDKIDIKLFILFAVSLWLILQAMLIL